MKKWWKKSSIRQCCGQIISGIKDVIAICKHSLQAIATEAILAVCVAVVSAVASMVA